MITSSRISSIRKRLLAWFDIAKRDLPWRKSRDPYAILVSELMLQQTQVQTMLPYYHRFMDRFPDLTALAQAAEEEVLRYWSGLGYYRRARNLHRLARDLTPNSPLPQGEGNCSPLALLDRGGASDGEKGVGGVRSIPSNKKDLLRLPGVGEYTAGAILSIAYNQRVPLVDGNVERVLARLFGVESDVAVAAGKKEIWRLAEKLVSPERPGCFNQALMELGATLCLPNQPKCLLCPISSMCRGYREGTTGLLPVKTRNSKRETVVEGVLLVECEGQWLLTNRNEQRLYQGMWQFPWAWRQRGDGSIKAILERPVANLRLNSVAARKVHTTTHTVTFRAIQTSFFLLRIPPPAPTDGESFRWVAGDSLAKEALPSYQKKLIPRLEGFRSSHVA